MTEITEMSDHFFLVFVMVYYLIPPRQAAPASKPFRCCHPDPDANPPESGDLLPPKPGEPPKTEFEGDRCFVPLDHVGFCTKNSSLCDTESGRQVNYVHCVLEEA